MFQKGNKVRLKTVVPTGEVIKIRMDEDGIVWFLMAWNTNGVEQERWFTGDELESAE